jgi:hypothetical protein
MSFTVEPSFGCNTKGGETDTGTTIFQEEKNQIGFKLSSPHEQAKALLPPQSTKEEIK